MFNLFNEKDTHTVRMSDVVEVNAFAIMDPSLQQKETSKVLFESIFITKLILVWLFNSVKFTIHEI